MILGWVAGVLAFSIISVVIGLVVSLLVLGTAVRGSISLGASAFSNMPPIYNAFAYDKGVQKMVTDAAGISSDAASGSLTHTTAGCKQMQADVRSVQSFPPETKPTAWAATMPAVLATYGKAASDCIDSISSGNRSGLNTSLAELANAKTQLWLATGGNVGG